MGVALEHVGVFPGEHLLGDGLAHDRVDLAARRPDVFQKDLVALLVHAQRLLEQIGIHRACERVGDDQRRRGEIVGAHVGIDAALEIAIAREHRRGNEVLVVDRFRDLRRKRAGIADAGGAAEADEVVAELVQILLQARLVQIFRHHLRAGRQRGLDPRLDGEPFLRRLAREEPRADHDVRVRGVGAGGDRGDDDVAMAEIMVAAFNRNPLRRSGLAKILVEGSRRAKDAGPNLLSRRHRAY